MYDKKLPPPYKSLLALRPIGAKIRAHASTATNNFYPIMNDPHSTNSPTPSPEAGFAQAPAVNQAAQDLRSAAGEKIKDLTAQAASLKDKAIESAEHFRDVASEKAREARASAGEKAHHFKEIAEDQWSETREKALEFHSTAEDYIREHPTKCVLGALGIGFLIGLIVRR